MQSPDYAVREWQERSKCWSPLCVWYEFLPVFLPLFLFYVHACAVCTCVQVVWAGRVLWSGGWHHWRLCPGMLTQNLFWNTCRATYLLHWRLNCLWLQLIDCSQIWLLPFPAPRSCSSLLKALFVNPAHDAQSWTCTLLLRPDWAVIRYRMCVMWFVAASIGSWLECVTSPVPTESTSNEEHLHLYVGVRFELGFLCADSKPQTRNCWLM